MRRTSNLEQRARLGDARRWPAIFAGGDARKSNQVAPTEGWARRDELFRNGAIEFFGMKGAVFADGVAQQEIKHRPWRVTQLTITRDQSARFGLEIPANGFL